MKSSGKSSPAVILRVIHATASVFAVLIKGVSNAWVILLAIMTVSMCLAKPLYLAVAVTIGIMLSVGSHIKHRYDEKKKGTAPGPDEIGG